MEAKGKDIELGNYRVLKNDDGENWELGKGAFGTTFKAEHKHLPRFCALKVINDELIKRSNTKQRFLQEAQTASLLDHPNIAQIYDFGESEGVFYYAMTYCAGHDLEDYAKANGAQPWTAVRRMAKQIFSALTEAHDKGLLHRDIKPSNIMLAENDGSVNLKLIDFGLVKVLEQNSNCQTNVFLTNEGGFLGSPLTASPEQLQEEELDERSDLFSVGVTLWYLLLGASPFGEISTAQLVHQRLSSQGYDDHFPEDLEPEGVAVLSKLLSKDPGQRYASAREVLADLEDSEINVQRQRSAFENSDVNDGNVAQTTPVSKLDELKEVVEQVDADWSDIWDIVEIVHQDIYGALYNCVSKLDSEMKSSIFIPDPQSTSYNEVVVNADRLLSSNVSVLSPFVKRGDYDGSTCYLSTSYPIADVSLLIKQEGELKFSKFGNLFRSIAAAIDESVFIGMPGLQLSNNEIKLSFAGQQLQLSSEKWVNYFNNGSLNKNELLDSIEVFAIPKFVHLEAMDDVSMTLSNEDLATSMLSSFAGFIYSAVSGMKVKQSAYLTPTAHVSTSNFAEESNDYISKVIAAETTPSSANGFLDKLSEMENTSFDASASVFKSHEIKDKRRDSLLDAHQSMAGVSGIFKDDLCVASGNHSDSNDLGIAKPVSSETKDESENKIAEAAFTVQAFDTPEEGKKDKQVKNKKSVESKSETKSVSELDSPKVVKRVTAESPAGVYKDSKLLPILIIVGLVAALTVGGYFGYEHFFDTKKKRSRRAMNADAGEKSGGASDENADENAGEVISENPEPKNPSIKDTTNKPINTAYAGKLVTFTFSDLKGLVISETDSFIIVKHDGREIGKLSSEGENKFTYRFKPEHLADWNNEPLLLKLKSKTHRIVPIRLLKSGLTEASGAYTYESSIDVKPDRLLTFTSVIKFAGVEYPDTAELIKPYLYPVDIGLDLKKEIKGEEVTLVLPIDVVFPIKTEFILPGCVKIKKSITENTNKMILEMKLSKKSVKLHSLPAYDEMKFKPDLDTIDQAKLREMFSKVMSTKPLLPKINANGLVEIQLPNFKGELELIRKDGKSSVTINSDAHTIVFPTVGKKYSVAVKELITSAESGVTDSQYKLGLMFTDGDGVKKDLKSAAGWFMMAAEQGDILAKNNIASMYLEGSGVNMDQRKAVQLFKQGSDVNNAESSKNLGLCYMKGWGVEKDIKEAVKYYEKAAKGGVTSAYGDLGVIYGQPELEMLNLDKSIEYFTKGSDAGHGASSFNLGVIYGGGMGKDKLDKKKSIRYYKKAKKQNYKPADKALKDLGIWVE